MNLPFCSMQLSHIKLLQVKSREYEMMALQEERHRREELERKLQEETSLREELVTQQIKYREKQKQQVSYTVCSVSSRSDQAIFEKQQWHFQIS